MSSLWRCSVCKKAGLEEDFLFVPIDETHETVYCYECAPESALKQQWPVDEESNDDTDREEVR
jgi:hypothetical protein